MVDVLKIYMDSKEAEIAEKDKILAEKDKILAEKDKILAEQDKLIAEITEKDTSFVTYLVNKNKSNEEIKKLVKDVTDDFINKIRESIIHS